MKPLNQVFWLWVTGMSKRWKVIFQNMVFLLVELKTFYFLLGREALSIWWIHDVDLIALVILTVVNLLRGCNKHLLCLIDENLNWLLYIFFYLMHRLPYVHQCLYLWHSFEPQLFIEYKVLCAAKKNEKAWLIPSKN